MTSSLSPLYGPALTSCGKEQHKHTLSHTLLPTLLPLLNSANRLIGYMSGQMETVGVEGMKMAMTLYDFGVIVSGLA